MTEHKHADILRAIADGVPASEFEIQHGLRVYWEEVGSTDEILKGIGTYGTKIRLKPQKDKVLQIKPLDIVKTPRGHIALVNQVCDDGSISIQFLNAYRKISNERNAWWNLSDGLEVIDSIPRLLANCMSQPFSGSKNQGDKWF